MERTSHLDETTVSALEDLMKANADSASIFREAAKETEKSQLASLFGDIAGAREKNAKELQGALALTGEHQDVETSLTHPLRKWWIEFRGKMQPEHEVGLLSALESAEDKILQAYKDALETTAGSPLNSTLEQQRAAVKAHHDRIRDLRDSAKSRG